MSKPLGEMTQPERDAAVKRVLGRFQAELDQAAGAALELSGHTYPECEHAPACDERDATSPCRTGGHNDSQSVRVRAVRCATIACGTPAGYTLHYTMRDDRDAVLSDDVCEDCGNGYLRRPALRAVLTPVGVTLTREQYLTELERRSR